MTDVGVLFPAIGFIAAATALAAGLARTPGRGVTSLALAQAAAGVALVLCGASFAGLSLAALGVLSALVLPLLSGDARALPRRGRLGRTAAAATAVLLFLALRLFVETRFFAIRTPSETPVAASRVGGALIDVYPAVLVVFGILVFVLPATLGRRPQAADEQEETSGA